MTTERQKIVSRTTLARTYDYLNLDNYIIGKPESLEEISDKSKSDFIEAIIAAVYLDSNNISKAHDFIVNYVIPFSTEEEYDIKSKLFEYFAKNKIQYELSCVNDNLNPPRHIATLKVDDLQFMGSATTKKEASVVACKKYIERMNLNLKDE